MPFQNLELSLVTVFLRLKFLPFTVAASFFGLGQRLLGCPDPGETFLFQFGFGGCFGGAAFAIQFRLILADCRNTSLFRGIFILPNKIRRDLPLEFFFLLGFRREALSQEIITGFGICRLVGTFLAADLLDHGVCGFHEFRRLRFGRLLPDDFLGLGNQCSGVLLLD
ncbi:MAG: hypothetical protein IJH79_06645, partial [Lentisphaeria bacterium]|nr:hypothetical protein [Lentisphaeria bacterium]